MCPFHYHPLWRFVLPHTGHSHILRQIHNCMELREVAVLWFMGCGTGLVCSALCRSSMTTSATRKKPFVSVCLLIMPLTFSCRLAISVGCLALKGYAMHRMTKTYSCSFFLRSSSSLCSFSRSSFSSLTAEGLGLVGRALLRLLLLGARPPELLLVMLGETRDPAWGAFASLLSSSTIPSDSSSLDDGSSILLQRRRVLLLIRAVLGWCWVALAVGQAQKWSKDRPRL